MNPTLDMQTEHVLGSNVKMGKCENAVNGRTRKTPLEIFGHFSVRMQCQALELTAPMPNDFVQGRQEVGEG